MTKMPWDWRSRPLDHHGPSLTTLSNLNFVLFKAKQHLFSETFGKFKQKYLIFQKCTKGLRMRNPSRQANWYICQYKEILARLYSTPKWFTSKHMQLLCKEGWPKSYSNTVLPNHLPPGHNLGRFAEFQDQSWSSILLLFFSA